MTSRPHVTLELNLNSAEQTLIYTFVLSTHKKKTWPYLTTAKLTLPFKRKGSPPRHKTLRHRIYALAVVRTQGSSLQKTDGSLSAEKLTDRPTGPVRHNRGGLVAVALQTARKQKLLVNRGWLPASPSSDLSKVRHPTHKCRLAGGKRVRVIVARPSTLLPPPIFFCPPIQCF